MATIHFMEDDWGRNFFMGENGEAVLCNLAKPLTWAVLTDLLTAAFGQPPAYRPVEVEHSMVPNSIYFCLSYPSVLFSGSLFSDSPGSGLGGRQEDDQVTTLSLNLWLVGPSPRVFDPATKQALDSALRVLGTDFRVQLLAELGLGVVELWDDASRATLLRRFVRHAERNPDAQDDTDDEDALVASHRA
eukprot:gnl/Hemi2/2586_TR917_c0_g1_i1.p1 gnl/Hemi2/2586_TR917_c0_g1~~gnl/Hemi2/2586_TR917_c0_g1_i1.p1  ORF type:complete len:189 (-),score=54.73 gnl/Hemi2/2586_TR917_c0_g1_i1:181-747(-)